MAPDPASPSYTPSNSVVVEPTPAPTETVVYQAPPQEVVVIYRDDLSPYGRWVNHPRYGRCWVPYNTPGGWQPYTVGHWAYTSDGNCAWVAEGEEVQWGGIVYHYGQWAFTPDAGWVWVPGTVWAPAWVAWRDGGGYCGWAPLPPECGGREEISYREVDTYCPPERYVYCDERQINQGRVDRHIVRNNVTIVNQTTNITNITVVNNRVVNDGVPVRRIEQRTGTQVERVAVVDVASATEARDRARNGEAVHYTNASIDRIQSQRKVNATPAQLRAADERQTFLNNKLEHEKQVGQNTQQQLDDQRKNDQRLQLESQAARQQQADLSKQLQQQAQADRDKEAQLQKQQQADKAIDRQKQAEEARQAAAEKQLSHQRDLDAAKAAHDQQIEAAKQAQREQELERQTDAETARKAHEQQVEAAQQAHEQQVRAVKQAQADKAAERQRELDAAKQAELEKAAAHQKQVEAEKQAHDQEVAAAREAERQKVIEHQQQVEADKQAAAERAKQAAVERQAEHDRQVQAQKQAEAEK